MMGRGRQPLESDSPFLADHGHVTGQCPGTVPKPCPTGWGRSPAGRRGWKQPSHFRVAQGPVPSATLTPAAQRGTLPLLAWPPEGGDSSRAQTDAGSQTQGPASITDANT